ncbi:hypothetical protein [uncultured Sphingomonas sp.]|uniref:hypothetical protein n=1 Tax=uncultured Sphingomonas sp. TaxID=158754 RepID=UPI0025F8BF76|nr:hypothetical protein [uncultured Sphingomonas sp.]
MTAADHMAHAIGVGCIAVFVFAGGMSVKSIVRDLGENHTRIAEVWGAMVDRIAARWHAIAVLFPVASSDQVDPTPDTPEVR